MRSIGSFLLFLGVGSVILQFIGYEFKLLMWINNWGETAGWIIRGVMIVAGGAIMFMNSSDEEDGDEESHHEEQKA